jgi:tRNA threonylcarbamoyl adenosine modification protein YeaZ
MRTLAIDCATEACSIALFDDRELIAWHHDVIGRGHAERLVPLIAELPERGRADHILVSLGPGSFTGVRIGLAAARALGLAWGAEVLGYPTLALVAAMAREHHPGPATVCMTGGHGEWFVQDFGADGAPESGLTSLEPEDATQIASHEIVAGSQAKALVERRGSGRALAILPDARHAIALPGALLTAELSPIYGRGPDAKLPQAR